MSYLSQALGVATGLNPYTDKRDPTGENIVIPYLLVNKEAMELFAVMELNFTPHRVVDEVIFIFTRMIRGGRDNLTKGPSIVTARIYENVIMDELLEENVTITMARIEDLLLAYDETINEFYQNMLGGLSFILQQHGIDVVERLRYYEFIPDAIVLEIGDEDESVCAGLGHGRIPYRY